MRLSEAVDRIFEAIDERLDPGDKPMLVFTRGLVKNTMMHFGDLELNIEVRRVPVEVIDVAGKTEAEDP